MINMMNTIASSAIFFCIILQASSKCHCHKFTFRTLDFPQPSEAKPRYLKIHTLKVLSSPFGFPTSVSNATKSTSVPKYGCFFIGKNPTSPFMKFLPFLLLKCVQSCRNAKNIHNITKK